MAIKKISTSSLFNNTRYSKVMAGTSQVQDVVDPPTIDSVTPGGYQVTVAFTPKVTGSPATTYTVTATPGGATVSGASSPLVMTGLTPGTAYTFTVKGTNNRSIVGNESPASASATPDASFQLEYIVVAGGGGGGGSDINKAGGGGGGGYRSSFAGQTSGAGTALESAFTALAGNTFGISIGGGGGGGRMYDPYNNTSSGGDTTFGNITSTGGGRGGNSRNLPDSIPSTGGSGGGASAKGPINSPRSGAAGIVGQGSAGGGGGFYNGPGPDYYYQGGTGGGGNGSSGVGRAGGGASATGFGFGGGGMYGGGNGGGTAASQSGTVNTGGGGAVGQFGPQTGGNGGSGVVVIRYPSFVPDITTIPGGLTYTRTTPTGYKMYTFTAGSGTITL